MTLIYPKGREGDNSHISSMPKIEDMRKWLELRKRDYIEYQSKTNPRYINIEPSFASSIEHVIFWYLDGSIVGVFAGSYSGKNICVKNVKDLAFSKGDLIVTDNNDEEYIIYQID